MQVLFDCWISWSLRELIKKKEIFVLDLNTHDWWRAGFISHINEPVKGNTWVSLRIQVFPLQILQK